VGDAEHVEICDLGQRGVMIDRVGDRGIVVAGQEHHRQCRGRDDRGGAIEQVGRQAVAIEGVAGEHDDVGGGAARRAQDAGEPRRSVAAMQPRGVVVIDVQIGAVDDHEIAGRRGHCSGHGRRTYRFTPHWQPQEIAAGRSERRRAPGGFPARTTLMAVRRLPAGPINRRGASDMSASDEYRSNAENCLRMAQTVHNLQDRPFWLALAQSWLQLADHPARGASLEQSRHGAGVH
jgi:hypothetical protein